VAEDVPVGPVNSLEDVFNDPQVKHNGSIIELEHPKAGKLRQAGPAAHFDKTIATPGRVAPLLGEHTEEVLAEFGYGAQARALLRGEGVIP